MTTDAKRIRKRTHKVVFIVGSFCYILFVDFIIKSFSNFTKLSQNLPNFSKTYFSSSWIIFPKRRLCLFIILFICCCKMQLELVVKLGAKGMKLTKRAFYGMRFGIPTGRGYLHCRMAVCQIGLTHPTVLIIRLIPLTILILHVVELFLLYPPLGLNNSKTKINFLLFCFLILPLVSSFRLHSPLDVSAKRPLYPLAALRLSKLRTSRSLLCFVFNSRRRFRFASPFTCFDHCKSRSLSLLLLHISDYILRVEVCILCFSLFEAWLVCSTLAVFLRSFQSWAHYCRRSKVKKKKN